MSSDWLLPEQPAPYPSKQIGQMHGRHGHGPEGATCGTCKHLRAKQYTNTYFKCLLYGDTGGPASDWRKKWPACGRYEVRA